VERAIVKLVDENNPGKYGINASFWDCIELHKFFLANGLYVGRETIRRILKINGFRYVKTDYEYAQLDEAKKASFLMELDLLIENREKGSTILFGDEMGAQLHPKKGYVWTRVKKPLVKTFSSRKKVNIVGAVNPLTGSHAEMFTMGKMGEEKFVEFLDRLYTRFKGKIYFFLDNFRIHKSELVKSWVKQHPRMNLLFLPPYSPNLNVVEWLWNYSRRKFLNNRLFGKVRQLLTSYSWFLRKLPKATVKHVCNIDILLNRIT
jgi:transposase